MKLSGLLLAALFLVTGSWADAQDTLPSDSQESASLESPPVDLETNPVTPPSTEPEPMGLLQEKAKEFAVEASSQVESIAVKVDQNKSAQKAADGILGPIYKLAESLSFPAFHWIAFGLMAAGVVGFALQIVLGKLFVLFKGSINIREILSDVIGLIISSLGLVLTTQAAAENSTFTHSPAAVLSAAACGTVIGIMLYRWGQDQELNAVTGQRAKPKA